MLNIFFMVNKRFCHLSSWIYKQGYTVMLKHFHLWIPVFKSFGVCFWIQHSEFVVVASALLFLKLVANKVKNCGVLRSLLGQKENNKNKSIFHCQLWRQQKASCFLNISIIYQRTNRKKLLIKVYVLDHVLSSPLNSFSSLQHGHIC